MGDDGFGNPDEMNSEERALAERIYSAILATQEGSARSQQARSYLVGISDLGGCSEKLRRYLERQPASDRPDLLPAFIGTWLGEGVEAAIRELMPEAITQSSVSVTFECDQGTFTLPGHPDVVIPSGIVLDVKTSRSLQFAPRDWAHDLQKRIQRHAYAKGAHEAGMFDEGVSLEDVKVGNLWLDRSAEERRPYLRLEPYDPSVLAEAERWLDEVIYCYKQGIEAPKEPPRQVCEAGCIFFTVCRSRDTDVSGRITDQQQVDAVEMMVEAKELKKRAGIIERAAKERLRGVEGSTGEYSVRWTEVGSTAIDAYIRKGYRKLDVTPLRK